MHETRYDLASSALIAGAVGLGALVALLIAVWLSNLLPENVTLTPMMEAGDGGWEDGDPNETLNVESPEDPTDDPSLSNDQQETQLEQVLEQVIQVSDSAAQLTAPTEFSDSSSGGNPGSAEGTGGRPYGSGGPGRGGAKREQRWFVQFADKGDLKSYARQLDFFGIELGVVFRDGRIIYVKNLSTSPVKREERVSSDDQRLFMNWEGGDRIKADRELLASVGVADAENGTILHFYPTQTEQMLARLEQDYANRPPEQIRRTYFQVKRDGNAFEFTVSSQKLK
jgi:hypothetical protein